MEWYFRIGLIFVGFGGGAALGAGLTIPSILIVIGMIIMIVIRHTERTGEAPTKKLKE